MLKELNNLNVILKKSGDLNKEDCNLQDSQKVDIKWFNVSILMQLFPQILSRKPPLEVFSEINKNILYRSYLHHKFNEDEAKRKLNKLLSIERGFLCEVFGWYSDEFYEIGINNEKEKQSCNNLRRNIKYNDNRPPSYNRMKFLLEQEKVGKFLSQDWGVVGGTIAVLNYRNGKGSSPRLAPCVERAPEGIHFPWCFDSFNTKRKFLKKLFAGGISNTKVDLGMTDNDIVNTFIVQRELPKSILDIAIDITIDFNYTPVDTILEVIKGYLNNSLFHTYDREDWVKCSYILTICVELIVRKLASAFKDEGIDSVHEIFYDEEKEMKYLSELERKLGVFMVPAEESISVACEWIKKMSSNNKLNLESVNQKWIRLAEHKRIRDWREYQNKEVRKKLQFNDPAVGPRCDAVKQRFSPVFWLYLFDPFIEDSQSINIPHVMFVKMQKLQLKTSENLTEDTLSSFAAVYFNDEIFQRFWNRREQIWCNGSNDVNEMNLKAYVHHLQNFVYPVASYNVNLELNEEREKLAREREAKKFLEREINKERMFNHIYIPVFTGMESILSKIRNKEKVEIDYIGILKNQVNALFLISSIRQRMKDFDLKKYVNFLDKTKTKLVPLSIILENILYIALFSRVIQVDIADYLTKKGFEISKEFNLVNLRNVLFSRRNFLRNDLFPKMNFEISNNIKLLVPTNDDSDTGDYCGFLLIVFMGIIDNFLKHPFLGNWYLRIKYIEEKNRSGNIILSYYPTGYQYGESEDFKLFTDVTNDGLGLQVFNDFLTNFDCSLYLRKGIGRVKRSNYKMYEQKIQFNNECNKLLRVTNGMDML